MYGGSVWVAISPSLELFIAPPPHPHPSPSDNRYSEPILQRRKADICGETMQIEPENGLSSNFYIYLFKGIVARFV